MVAHNSENVARLVQECLRRGGEKGNFVRVLAEEVRQGSGDDEWWWVPVVFDPDPYQRYVFYELLSDVEELLEDTQHLNVLLVPRMTESNES